MKNVFKRSIQLLNILNSNSQVTTNFIKDNINDYRNLSEQAFRRSFERDKSLLRSFGYLIEYENDKWSYDKGYSLSGNFIFQNIKKDKKIDTTKFIHTYQLLSRYYLIENLNNINNELVSKVVKAITEKRRLGFNYLDSYRKIKPEGLKYFDSNWYLAGFEDKKFKTFKVDYISNLKIGTQSDLYKSLTREYKFSWEDSPDKIEMHIQLSYEIYIINRYLFSHKLLEVSKDTESAVVKFKTNDIYGLIKFLLLCNDFYKILYIDDKEQVKRFINGK